MLSLRNSPGKILLLASVMLIGAACHLPFVAVPGEAPPLIQGTPTPGPLGPTAISSAVTVTPPADQWVPPVLAMRSVQIVLQAELPDGTSVRVTADVDAQGNYRVVDDEGDSHPVEDFKVGGLSYSHLKGSDPVVEIKGDVDFLEDILSGPASPAMWLSFMEESSFSLLASEPKGGFTTDHYRIQGNLDQAIITGDLWMDADTNAMVDASMEVPGSLLLETDQSGNKPLRITFQVEKAEVKPIQLPAIAQGGAGTPSPGNPQGAGLPAGVPLYPGAQNFSVTAATMATFTTSDAIAAVAKFYDSQLKANGWSLATSTPQGNTSLTDNWRKGETILEVSMNSANGITRVILVWTNSS